MGSPEQHVDIWYSTITQIHYRGSELGHCTGFFFSNNGDTYLITNKHCVDITSVNGKQLNEIKIFTRQNPNDLNQLQHHNIKLIQDGSSTWLEHPENSQIDLVAIPLTEPIIDEKPNIDPLFLDKEEWESGTFSLTKDNFRPDHVIIGAGTQAMIIGYPVRGSSPYYPLGRSALIASPYGTYFEDEPCFATDARMTPGTSGSPVFTVPSAMRTTNENSMTIGASGPYLIGVHSGTIDRPDLNLNQAWYIELILDIINSE